jgi:hypothetical protein
VEDLIHPCREHLIAPADGNPHTGARQLEIGTRPPDRRGIVGHGLLDQAQVPELDERCELAEGGRLYDDPSEQVSLFDRGVDAAALLNNQA